LKKKTHSLQILDEDEVSFSLVWQFFLQCVNLHHCCLPQRFNDDIISRFNIVGERFLVVDHIYEDCDT